MFLTLDGIIRPPFWPTGSTIVDPDMYGLCYDSFSTVTSPISIEPHQSIPGLCMVYQLTIDDIRRRLSSDCSNPKLERVFLPNKGAHRKKKPPSILQIAVICQIALLVYTLYLQQLHEQWYTSSSKEGRMSYYHMLRAEGFSLISSAYRMILSPTSIIFNRWFVSRQSDDPTIPHDSD